MNKKFYIKFIVIFIIIAGITCLSGQIYRLRYPIKFESTVAKYANEYAIDPYLIYAVIRTESFFNQKAISRKDARGLMQIMPETGKWIAQQIGIENYNKEDLFDCDKNIKMGTWYLDYLIQKFNGDINLAIIAYNAGPGNIKNWIENETIINSGTSIENIPFGETEKYQKKILETYEIYKNLYR